MKILYSCLSKSWGGMEMFTLNAALQLLQRDINTELLCYAGSRLQTEADKCGIKYHTVKSDNYLNPAGILHCSGVIKKGDFDLIHSQATKDLWTLVPALKIASSGIPLVITKQVGSFIVKKDFLHRFLYNRVTIALAISNVIIKNLLDTTPLDASRIELLHNGVDTLRFDPENTDLKKVRAEYKINDNEIVTGMLARFSWGKGHEEFLFAAKELLKNHDNLKFMIVGEPSRGEDEYAAKIKKIADDYGIEDKVIFTGFRSDTPEVIGAMDIFAFPSHSEAFGIALAEAMSMGRPSVCSNSDGVLDLTVDGVTGYLFKKQDGSDLANKLELLINSDADRTTFGIAARKRAIEKFDIGVLTDKVIGIYNRLIRSDSNQETDNK
jgi:glycosyltransferase involved in cell wall biosynthesis